ncbi:hypothetical protein EAH79_03480 [Sphingomonas koreensis]|nr:hypothetical protein EAH79_03480 [Sphingomonas koreensis]
MVTREERFAEEKSEFYRLTGEIIREWVELEVFLSMWLIYLLGVDEFRARVIWDGFRSFRARTNLLERLIRNFADESVWDEAFKILAKIQTLASKRNMLAHTFGHVGERANRLVFVQDLVDEKGEVNFVGQKNIDTANLRTWITEITEARNRVAVFKKDRLAPNIWDKPLMHRNVTLGI